MDKNLLSGLESLGLGGFEGLEIYSSEEKIAMAENALSEKVVVEIKEEDLLFDKHYTCPVCDEIFVARTVRTGKAKALEPDPDLRPRFEGIDTNKYDVVACPFCGYASLSSFFQYLAPSQKKAVKEQISTNFRNKPSNAKLKTFSYDDALERYKLALVNSIVKKGKTSEKAYVCLKTAWILRGKLDTLDIQAEDYHVKEREISDMEKSYLTNAYDGFVKARATESFPICGMDEMTLDYLIGAIAMQIGQFDVAQKMVSGILTSRKANQGTKNRARALKDLIVKRMRESQLHE